MRLILVVLIISTLTMTALSQKTDTLKTNFVYKNSVQAELFGHGLLYSLNYERVIFNGQKFKTTGQLGFSYYPPKTGFIDIWIPLVINEIFSFNKHHIELGLGHVFTNEAVRYFDYSVLERQWGGFLTARLGYRYQKHNGRLIVRAGFTPFFEYRDLIDFYPSGGLALGYSF